MSSFTSDLVVKSCSDTEWALARDFYFYLDRNKREEGINIPDGFVTDFASVPKLLWSILPPTGRHTKAAVLHDFLYSTTAHGLTRKECDLYFLKAMEVLGVGKKTRNVMYYGVRLFGRKYFKEVLGV